MKTLLLISFALALSMALAFPSHAKPSKKKLTSEAVSEGLDESLSDIQKTVGKIREDLERAQTSGKEKSKEEIERTKAALEKLKQYFRNLSSSVTDEIDATVKKLNKMAPDIE